MPRTEVRPMPEDGDGESDGEPRRVRAMRRPLYMARIAGDSPRYTDWVRDFGSDTVPIESPVTVRSAGSDGRERAFYKLSLSQVAPDQVARLIQRMARLFRRPRWQIEADIRVYGVPILAEDVVVFAQARALF